ncbi:MAG: hypothetical protein JWO62_2907 [Acidimicrobiaceae bacterium]|nr:hypothetical protein [Acidimicrobiaceae bacterium]
MDELGERPHVVVDGGARPGTVLALTHWPSSPTPVELARDLSAEIALAYLDAPMWWSAVAEAVTNDHLDQDGLVALYALVDPSGALARAELIVEVARVGDFAVVRDEAAALVAFSLATLADPERTPLTLAPSPGPNPGAAWTAACYHELLGRLPELLDHPGRSRPLYAEELAALEASRRVVASGNVALVTIADAGLGVVDVDERVAAVSTTPFTGALAGPLHPAAVHAATDSSRILVAQGRRYRYYDRYETWVRYVSTALPLRRDLRPLAERLSAEERGGASWVADPPGALGPSLRVAGDGESSLDLARVTELVRGYLLEAPVAWDPWRAAGALVGPGTGRDGPGGQGLSGPAGPRAGTSGRGRSRWPDRWRGRSSA